MNLKRHVPNALTLLNLTLGAIAIIAVSQGMIQISLLLMGGCLVADVLDGALARRLAISSKLGIQLDSLADIVSFGVLPGMMIFYAGFEYQGERFGLFPLAVLASLSTASAGLRLARFNMDIRPREYFWGLATPAGAMMVAGWLWADDLHRDFGLGFSALPWLPVIISLFLVIAYQVPLKLPNLKSPKAGFATATFLIVTVGIGLFTIGPISIPLGVLAYFALGLLNLAVKWY